MNRQMNKYENFRYICALYLQCERDQQGEMPLISTEVFKMIKDIQETSKRFFREDL